MKCAFVWLKCPIFVGLSVLYLRLKNLPSKGKVWMKGPTFRGCHVLYLGIEVSYFQGGEVSSWKESVSRV